MRKINKKLEPYTPEPIPDEPVPQLPTLEQRLEAVEAALLEQLLRGISDV